MSTAVQLHSTVLDFWMIGVYTELDLKGNLFSSRKLMLQAIRNNEVNPDFYVEYFKYETKFLEKVRQRREILNGEDEKKLDFVDPDADMEVEEEKVEEGRFSGSSKLVEIVF